MRSPSMNVGNNALARAVLPQPPVKRPRNREATIRSVLESAQRLFTTKGFDNTSLVDIAAETGLSPRGVILHFSSKADIAAELMIRDMRARAQAYREDGVAHADAIARLRHFFGWLADGDRRIFINFPALWAFAARWSPKLEGIAEQATAELLAPARMALDTGIASGQLRHVDPAVACEMLWNTYQAGLRRAAIHGGKPADALEQVERAIELLRA
jgi:AcrR family transcriptional regulator